MLYIALGLINSMVRNDKINFVSCIGIVKVISCFVLTFSQMKVQGTDKNSEYMVKIFYFLNINLHCIQCYL